MKKRDQPGGRVREGCVPPTARSAVAFGALIYLCTKHSCFHTISEQNLCFQLRYIHAIYTATVVCRIDLIVYCIM